MNLPDLRAVKRVLIIRLSSIGDVVHALPVSAALGKSFPHLELTWIVEEMSADVVVGNPYLHDVIVVPRQKWKAARRSPRLWGDYARFLSDLRHRRFDVTLDLQGYGKSALMAWATGAPHRVGWWKMQDGAQLISKPIPRRPDSIHRVDWFLDVPRALGAALSPVEFPLTISEPARIRAAALLRANGIDSTRPFAVMNPATGDKLRRWGAENYARVIRLLWQEHHLPTVLIGAGKDVALCEETVRRAIEHLPDSGKPRVLAGKTSVAELAALLEIAAIVICSDTGAAHIAAALGTPVVGIYGPTDPAHAGPYGQLEGVISNFTHCPAACNTRCCAVPLPTVVPADLNTDATMPNPGVPAFPLSHCLYAITPEQVVACAKNRWIR